MPLLHCLHFLPSDSRQQGYVEPELYVHNPVV